MISRTGPEPRGARARKMTLAVVSLMLGLLAISAFFLRDGLAARWWIHKLWTGSPEEQRVAMARLGELRAVGAVPDLARRIEENGKTLDSGVVHFDDKGPVLATRTRNERRSATGAILGFDIVESRYSLDPAAAALLHIGKPAVPALVRLVKSEGWYAPAQALYVLGELGPSSRQALPALRAFLKRCARRDDGLEPAVQEAIEKISAGRPAPAAEFR